jgi:hypothetical protein
MEGLAQSHSIGAMLSSAIRVDHASICTIRNYYGLIVDGKLIFLDASA